MKISDLTGHKFNRLTVISYCSLSKDGKSLWKCVCECGKTSIVRAANLKSGTTQSCGCLASDLIIQRNTKHGLKHHPLYIVWRGIKARCLNANNPGYDNYGGRGITVCSEWLNSETFINWAIENGWEDGLEIDRINNNGNYEPSNCRFVTPQENQLNKRNNRLLTYRGTTKCISVWSRITGIPEGTITYRLKKGMGIDQALTSKCKP